MHDCVYNVIHYEFVYTFSVALVMFQRYVFIAVSSSSVCKAAGNNENSLNRDERFEWCKQCARDGIIHFDE